MKIIYVFFSILFIHSNISGQSLKIGEKIPDISIGLLLNASQNTLSTQSLKNKILIIDFWATWCTPCIKGFDKLEKLQSKYKNDIQVIAVSEESTSRIEKFIKNKPLNFLVAADTTGFLKKWFPHISIPHLVIIDGNGIIKAITNGDELNEAVIEQVIAGITPSVKYKNDNELNTGEAFKQVAPGEEYFGMKGYDASLRSGKMASGNSLMYTNLHFSRFYLDVYNMKSTRLRYENINKSEQAFNNENRYSLYIAIKEENYKKLVETLKQKLASEFEYKTRIAKERDTVYVLSTSGVYDTNYVKPANTIVSSGSNKGKYSSKNTSIGKAMANYLEGFGIVDGVVLDETNNKNLYDISFTWEPEKEGAVEEFLSKLGLKMEKAIREYDVLIIFK